MAHGNARFGPVGRRELVRLMIEVGMPERRAAACLRSRPARRIDGRRAGCAQATRIAATAGGRWIARVGRIAHRDELPRTLNNTCAPRVRFVGFGLEPLPLERTVRHQPSCRALAADPPRLARQVREHQG